MARTKRISSRYSRSTPKWASHFIRDYLENTSEYSGNFDFTMNICANSLDNTTPAPSIIKVKNFKCCVDLIQPTAHPNLQALVMALCYVPEGYNPNGELMKQHPEWIITWKGIDLSSGSATGTQVMYLNSKMSRNLNSGDRIMLIISGVGNKQATYKFAMYCQYVSRAN